MDILSSLRGEPASPPREARLIYCRRLTGAVAGLMIVAAVGAPAVTATVWDAPERPPQMGVLRAVGRWIVVSARWPEARAGGRCDWRLEDADGVASRKLRVTEAVDGGCSPIALRASLAPAVVVMLYDGPPGSGAIAEGHIRVVVRTC